MVKSVKEFFVSFVASGGYLLSSPASVELWKLVIAGVFAIIAPPLSRFFEKLIFEKFKNRKRK